MGSLQLPMTRDMAKGGGVSACLNTFPPPSPHHRPAVPVTLTRCLFWPSEVMTENDRPFEAHLPGVTTHNASDQICHRETGNMVSLPVY